jgi:hypothetical protein
MHIRRVILVVLMLAAAGIGQEVVRVLLKDGSLVIGKVITGDPRSFVVETDTGQVRVVRSLIAQVTVVDTVRTSVGRTADGRSVHDIGVSAGRRAAENGDEEGKWLAGSCCAGLGCWPLGSPVMTVLARQSSVAVPPRLLVGASDEYAAGFRTGYERRIREIRRNAVTAGVVGSGVVVGCAVLLAFSSWKGIDLHMDLGTW